MANDVKASVPLAGSYTSKYSGEEIDALLGKVAGTSESGLSGRNLLINGDFRRPVNQQGKTEYAGTGYCIDRWKATVTGTVVALAGNGLRLTAPANKNAYLLQYFERPLSPGEYMLSALVPAVNGTGYIQIIYVDGTYGPAARISESGLFVVTAVATKEISRAVLQLSLIHI